MSHQASFGIRRARDFLDELVVPQHDDFVADNASSRHALLTVIVAYHMYEWVHGRSFTAKDFRTQYPTEQGLAGTFDLARRITNGTKHFRPKAKTSTQVGFSSDFSDDFARPLNVEYDDGTQESADVFLRKMVGFWKRQASSGVF